MSRDTLLFPTPCPYCGYNLDACTNASPAPKHPEPCTGDFTVCIECEKVLVFGDDLRPRKPTEQESTEALTSVDVTRVLDALRRAKIRRPRK